MYKKGDAMKKITLNIKDESKLDIFIRFLREINFIEISKIEKSTNDFETKSFNYLFGIWKNRSISLSDIREKAWGRSL